MGDTLPLNILQYLARKQDPTRADLVSTTELARALRAAREDVEKALGELSRAHLVHVEAIHLGDRYVFITQLGRRRLVG